MTIKLTDLTNDERCMMSFLNGTMPTTLKVGGSTAESTLSHRAALAMLSLIGRGLVAVEIFNDTGRCTYKVTEAAAPLQGKVSQAFLNKFGGFKMLVPNPERFKAMPVEDVLVECTMTGHKPSGAFTK